MKIKWYPDKEMSEIYQQTGMQFAFLSPEKDGFRQCHPFVLCRDFLHDAVKAHLNKNRWQIYGFEYEYEKYPPLDMSCMRVLVRKKILTSRPKDLRKISKPLKDSIRKFKRDMDDGLQLLNYYEDVGGLPISTMDETKDPNKNSVFIFTGSPVWMTASYLVSLYTFLIRLGDKEFDFKDNSVERNYERLMGEYAENKYAPKHDKKQKDFDNDISYLRKNWDKINIIMTRREELFGKDDELHEGYFNKNIQTGSFHDRCGIYNLCCYGSPEKNLNKKLKEMVDGKEQKTNKG